MTICPFCKKEIKFRVETIAEMKPILSQEFIMSDIYKNMMMTGLTEKDDMYNLANYSPNVGIVANSIWEEKFICILLIRFIFFSQLEITKPLGGIVKVQS